MPDGRKAYLKNGEYEAVDEWDPNDGTQSGEGLLSKLWHGLGSFFGTSGEIKGPGTLNWNGKQNGLHRGLVERINTLADHSGENLIVTSGKRTQADVERLKAQYDSEYGTENRQDFGNYWKWSKPGKIDQILNHFDSSTHSTGHAVDLKIAGKPWGSPEYRNLNRLGHMLGLSTYKTTDTKGHFNIKAGDEQTNAPYIGDPEPTPAPIPALVTKQDMLSSGSKGDGGNVVVGGSPTTIINAPQSSNGSGNTYPMEFWAYINGMSGAPAGGFI